MTDFDSSYKVLFSGTASGDNVLRAGRDFYLEEVPIVSAAGCALPTLARDLLHIGMAVYVVGRLTKRPSPATGGMRAIQLTVEVVNPEFWRAPSVLSLLHEILDFLGDEYWDLRFISCCRSHQAYFTDPSPISGIICLYSGGLDSAAGLARTLEKQNEPVYAITAEHHTQIKSRVEAQLREFRRAYESDLLYVGVDLNLVDAPNSSVQESTQRCRAFLFAALAGAFACCTGLSEIEIYENGVGAVNLPLTHGSGVGGRTTRSAHPTFLRRMSQLVTQAAGRNISYKLPFHNFTKAELISILDSSKDLKTIGQNTVSCAKFPLREPGAVCSCGLCPGCIERRYAFECAGIEEDAEVYKHDWLNGTGPKPPMEKLNYLQATLLQVRKLRNLSPNEIPSFVRDYFRKTDLVAEKESIEPWIDVLSRYAGEWTYLTEKAGQNNLFWSNWV